MGWNEQMEIEEKWYEAKNVPNVFEMTSKAAKSDEHLRSVIRNYLYGEAIIEDAAASTEEGEKETPAAEAKPATSKRPNLANAHKEKDETAKPAATAKPKTASRSLLDDAEEDLNDLD